ncbi:septal ring lytic transglycosylase RlpA family protein [Azospirillum soli]|uniref:septal ring lytic transglycosylase RlpA family protein n=1 Tax=Azospirillum soli TaxID=1304799 RepID=UPI001AE1D0BF|nr:septal ring lytic transglycosylase RlpA family protein [Azospirillum soli]MBP2315733.1 rare lipoprotein A [Azospirillum soli]
MVLAFFAMSVGACSSHAQIATTEKPTESLSTVIVSKSEPVFVHEGKASYYADSFHGRRTASGERFSQRKLTAASRTLPLGSTAIVTHADTGKSVEVLINDRGPYVKGRVIDLSRTAAEAIGMIDDGVVRVRVEARIPTQPERQLRKGLTRMVAELPPAPDGELGSPLPSSPDSD